MKRGGLILQGVVAGLGFVAAGLAAAATPSGTYQGLLQKIPAVPASADQAYAQWTDQNGSLKPGPQFTAFEQAMLQAQQTMPSAAPQNQAAVNALAQHYATPQGQAELKNMTMAQKMALAQQMSAQAAPQPGAMVVTPHDRALLKQIAPYSGVVDIANKQRALYASKAQLETDWQKADAALDAQELADRNKLKACPGEAGEPSEAALRDLARSYVPKHIAAAAYLPKEAALVAQARALVAPQIANADTAAAAWNGISSAGLKSQVAAGAAAAASQALMGMGLIESLTADASQRAATIIAKKNAMERTYANAKGC